MIKFPKEITYLKDKIVSIHNNLEKVLKKMIKMKFSGFKKWNSNIKWKAKVAEMSEIKKTLKIILILLIN
jgi:hypothetical protein